MATSLAKSENKVKIHHLHVKRFHIYSEKIAKMIPVHPEIFDEIRQFLAMSYYMMFTNEPCQLWSYWTKFNEIFTLYRGIICAVNSNIEVVITHSVSECQSDESGQFAIFSQNWLPWQRPLRYRKKMSRSFICTQNAFVR